jgi:1-deoxyxylulose-5-phosphate synthase
MSQTAFAWLMSKPVVSTPDRRRNKPNTVAALDVTLTGDEIRTLEEPYCPGALLVVGGAC